MEKGGHKKNFLKKSILFFIKYFICFSSFLFVFLFCFIAYINYKLPDIPSILQNNTNQKINICYSKDLEIIKIYNGNNFNTLNYEDLPSDLINALVATEDRNFFEHHGISYLGILRAIIVNFKTGHIAQGGSTITQQLSKMILKDNSRTFKRKFKELLLTKRIEKNLTKKDILLLYFNMAYFGSGKVGIQEASDFYFNKKVSNLNLEESAMLVGLLKAPTKYNPLSNKELSKTRTQQVILNMKNNGIILDNNVLNYILFDVDIKSNLPSKQNQNYYFTDYVSNEFKKLQINEEFEEVFVVTTLNKYLQNKVITITKQFIEEYKPKINNTELAIIIMNKKGEILSMIGGSDYSKTPFNRATNAYRQTGSLFKLFIYLAGFENGLQINDIFVDEKIKIGKWFPENYNKKYYGNITAQEAFEKSSNSVAIQVADYFGINKTIEMAKRLGLKNDFKNDYSILLGTKENSLLEIITSYAIVMNNGYNIVPKFISHIINDNNIIYSNNNEQNELLFMRNTTDKMLFLLYNVIKNGTGKVAKVDSLIKKTELYNSIHKDKKYFIGGKTGTTQNNRDGWFIGFADDYIIGIWMGNDDNSSTNQITGGNLPAILWKQIVESIVE